ncbi:MAG TPA: hypothetical protein VL096_12735 [Pirellulaceae bacterium]|nr:hypothetical protein [Pirellulaceae bacterium]
MAQWLGQFSGDTHATKVAGLESALRVAIDAMVGATPADVRDKKTLAVRKLAERLLAARLRLYRSRIPDLNTRGISVTRLTAKVAEAEAGGVALILKEFGVATG